MKTRICQGLTSLTLCALLSACAAESAGSPGHVEPGVDVTVDVASDANTHMDARLDSETAASIGDTIGTVDAAEHGDADSHEANVFTGAFEFRPTLAYAIPTELGFDLRFSTRTATCAELWDTLWLQDYHLHVIIDSEGQPIDTGFTRADPDFFAPPNAGDTRLAWLVVASDTSMTADSYSLAITDRTSTHLRGWLVAEFQPTRFGPQTDLETGHIEGRFDAEICNPPSDAAR